VKNEREHVQSITVITDSSCYSRADRATDPGYAELHALSNYSFLRGASSPGELVEQAVALGYQALAITDECSFAGIVRAHVRLEELRADTGCTLKLIVGTELALGDGCRLVLLAADTRGYESICALITKARRAAPKGEYRVSDALLEAACLDQVPMLLVPPGSPARREAIEHRFGWVRELSSRSAIALELHVGAYDEHHLAWLEAMGARHGLPLAAAGDVRMHVRARRALQDVVTCIRHGCTIEQAGRRLDENGERHLRSLDTLRGLYPAHARRRSAAIAAACTFDLSSLRYRYPREVVPAGCTATGHLAALVAEGARRRWPDGAPADIAAQMARELELVAELGYESYFLTVHDLVAVARERGILCQGRGSAANSAICYALGITSVDPGSTRLLFERFISRERDEPPDIDVDFEHQRREEIIQYLYEKYGRHRAALAATVITYRRRSAIRDVGGALGLDRSLIDALSSSLAWWDGVELMPERLEQLGIDIGEHRIKRFLWLVPQILGAPRHLSQHTGGFVISDADLSTLVPVENAAMPERTIVQWDKDDLKALGLMKVDVLALGMLSAIARAFELVSRVRGVRWTMATVPQDDPVTYEMIGRADTVGVFQIESRAQMAMLPKMRPVNWYDLVIEISLVRPGPIQGGMVHPYLARRGGMERIDYPDEKLRPILARTLGIPVFQEQVMELVMVAAGFDGGAADRLRRSMAAWRKAGEMRRFREPVVAGMLANGYDPEFAERLFKQIEGFGEYGFPESHAASFAHLVYVSCWLKCHEPAAFLCALLNSQPMGFYSPSALVQDAKRHAVVVLPVEVNRSERDHLLVARAGDDRASYAATPGATPGAGSQRQPAVRLGLRLVRGLSAGGIAQVLTARDAGGPFKTLPELVARTGLDRRDLGALVEAGALAKVSGHRHRAQWEALGTERLPGLLAGASTAEPETLSLPFPTEGEDLIADYHSLGLTLGRHPLALLRDTLAARRFVPSSSWEARCDARLVRIAGLVTMRQRPGSANGVMFITLEDEHGPVNVIVWPAVVERFRAAAIGARLLGVFGTVQRDSGVTSLIAGQLEDLSALLETLGRAPSHALPTGVSREA